MEETKNCPYCGEEILAGAKKCKHCGEWLDEHSEGTSLETEAVVKKTYKTHEPTFFQKLLQVYWVNPKSWRLEEFTIDNDTLTFRTQSGKEITGKLEELKIRTQTDKYGRTEVFVKKGDEKLHFKEISWMLEDTEWEEIFEILNSVPDTGKTTLSWITKVAEIAMKSVEQ